MILKADLGISKNVLGNLVVDTTRTRSLSGNIELSGLSPNHDGDFDTADVEEDEGEEIKV